MAAAPLTPAPLAPESLPPAPMAAAPLSPEALSPAPVAAAPMSPAPHEVSASAAPPSALGSLALSPEDAPLPAQAARGRAALFGSAWSNPEEPAPPPRDTSAFGSWDNAPEADLPEASAEAPMVIASNWDAAPAPVPATQQAEVFASNWGAPATKPVPDEWSEAPAASAIPPPSDRVELAQAADFVSWDRAPVVGAEEALPPAEPGDFVVESSSAAELANDFHAPATSSVDDDKLELASSADFIGAQQLTQTGEAWQSDGRGLALEEEEVTLEGEIIQGEAEIIQGVVVEEEPPQDAADSWGAAVSQPSSPALPAVVVPPLASAPLPAPAPARLAPPPPAPAPPVVVPSLTAQPPLQTRVATPIAAPYAQAAPAAAVPALVPVAPASPVSAAVPSGPTPTGPALFDRSGPVLSGDSTPVRVAGEHRVILHTLEGQVKRGAIRDADLCGPALLLELPAGGSEAIARERIKALFFMLTPGTRPPVADGAKVRVTFKDGRQVAGFSRDHTSPQAGFFVVPADNRTNTERIFIYRHGLQTVVPE